METAYRDLAEFGLPVITPGAPEFPELVRDIESRPEPFDAWPPHSTDRAAVLVNQSGQAVIMIAFVWRYTMAGGATRTGRFSNLGSSAQLEVLSGQAKAVGDLGQFILPGSKRLITEQGMFANNLDVLREDELFPGGGYVGGGGGGGRAGPDEGGFFESLTGALEQQRNTAREAAAALRSGASEGRVFEILLPLARRAHQPPPTPRHPASVLLSMFASMAIHRLTHRSGPELAEWFERIAQSKALPLRRP